MTESVPTSLHVGKSNEFRIKRCQEIVHNLPQTNYIILKYLITFTQKVLLALCPHVM